MSGNLIVEQLNKATLADEIDTVPACAMDLPSRLVASAFLPDGRSHLVLSPAEEFALSHTASGMPL